MPANHQPSPDRIEKLKEQLANLKQVEEKISSILKELQKSFLAVDTTIQKNIEIWQKHRETHFNKANEQLKALGISLTTEDLSELSIGSSTASSIQEKQDNLEKLGIKSIDSDFSIAIYDAIIAVKSRLLEKTDANSIKTIAKDLPVIQEEAKTAAKIKQQCKEELAAFAKTAQKHKETAEKLPVLSNMMLELAQQLASASNSVTALDKEKQPELS